MESANRFNSYALALLACAASALLHYFGNGLSPLWLLMWFAPLPVLIVALRIPAWQVGLLAPASWLAGYLNLWHYFHVLGAPPIAWFASCGTAALAFGLGVLLMRALAHRRAMWSAWLSLPATWTTFEFIRYWIWPHGSAACIAYSQLNFLPFLQTASLAGPWGMGFVLLLFPTGLALAVDLWPQKRQQAARLLGATCSVLAALLIFGFIRLSTPQGDPVVKVGLIASDANGGSSINDPGAPTQHLFENYATHARELIAQGAQVVVMPEDMGVVLDSTVTDVDALFQPIADQTGSVLIIGMARRRSASQHNEARIYGPGVAPRSYAKEHLLPPFETSRFTPGSRRTLFAAPANNPGQIWATAICKDLDFTNPARAYGQAGVGLMLTPAWDFRMDGFWHGHIAVMRAVEDGFSLVRSARDGLLTVADDRGRIVAEITSNAAPFATLLATVPAGHSHTVYLLLGDWFGWCAIALLALVLIQLVRKGRATIASSSEDISIAARAMRVHR